MNDQKIYFIREQEGDIENKLKKELSIFLNAYNKPVRAYLVQIKYDEKIDNFYVGLCINIENEKDQYLINNIGKIFKSIFLYDQHIDILFLNHQQELSLRKICCPFFVSEGHLFSIPDFYLFSNEGYELNYPIACFKRKKLYGKNPDGYLVCDIVPPIIGQKYVDISTWPSDIHQLIFVSRHLNHTLFPIKEWPAFVYVTVMIQKFSEEKDYYIDENVIKLIAWGELYKDKQDIKKSISVNST